MKNNGRREQIYDQIIIRFSLIIAISVRNRKLSDVRRISNIETCISTLPFSCRVIFSESGEKSGKNIIILSELLTPNDRGGAIQSSTALSAQKWRVIDKGASQYIINERTREFVKL